MLRLLFVPDSGEAELIGPDLCYGGFKWSLAVPGDDGNVYCPPWLGSKVLRIDTAKRSAYMMGQDWGLGGGRWGSVVPGQGGDIFCIPLCAPSVIRIDTAKEEPKPKRGADPKADPRLEILKPNLGTNRDKWSMGAVGRGGQIYCIPASASQVVRINFLDSSGGKKKKHTTDRTDTDSQVGSSVGLTAGV